LERLLEEGLSFEAIGQRVGLHASTVGYWAKKHGFVAAYRERHTSRGALSRINLEALVEEGLSIRAIAARLDRSPATVRHWLGRYELSTRQAELRAEAAKAKEQGLGKLLRMCPRHGPTPFVLEARGSYRCLRCRSEWVSDRRRRIKRTLVEEAGGRCAICGYDRHVGALQFHHVDGAGKSFSLAHLGVTRSLERAREEAGKCVLLCANCHAEVEAGLVGIPR
jgi:transposase